MPAAIRVDVELFSIAASDERPVAVKSRVRGLADAIADAVRKAVVQFAKTLTPVHNTNSSARPNIPQARLRRMLPSVTDAVCPAAPC